MQELINIMVANFNQYKNDFFNKLNFNFQKGKKILDVGCGPCTDAKIFIEYYGLEFYGTDVYEDDNVKKFKLNFKLGTIYKIPFKDDQFDYVFIHDVLHHIDEKHSKRKHLSALEELRRVCKKRGSIIIVEGNRYNPLFYPHMVKMRGHDHFKQSYFTEIMKEAFGEKNVLFKFFEAHLYPKYFLSFFKIYEFIMEHFFPKRFIAYNAAIIQKT